MSASKSTGWSASILMVLWAVAPRPTLWWPAVTAVFRLARPGWWHRAPFLPVPGGPYWRFRMVTAFGGTEDEGDGAPSTLSVEDVVSYLRWCQRSRPRRG